MEELIKGEVAAYFNFLATVLAEKDFLDNPRKVYNMDESGFPVKSRSQKIVSAKGKRMFVSLTNVGEGENIAIVVCFNAAGTYVSPRITLR
jgi:hypothetical protein